MIRFVPGDEAKIIRPTMLSEGGKIVRIVSYPFKDQVVVERTWMEPPWCFIYMDVDRLELTKPSPQIEGLESRTKLELEPFVGLLLSERVKADIEWTVVRLFCNFLRGVEMDD